MKKEATIQIHPDQKYIEALINNDTILIKDLYQKHAGKIKWMVLQNNGSEADAADIFQDALLSIYNRAKDTGFTLTCPLEAYLHLICKNKWINELKKRNSHETNFKDFEENASIDEDHFKLAEEIILQQVRKKLFDEKLAELSESCRELLELNWSGKSLQEVAELLQITYGYARKKKSECMEKLDKSIRESPLFKSLKR